MDVRAPGPDAESAARDRVDALFERFNDLTPADLAHIGLQRSEPAQRAALRKTVQAAADAAGRSALLGEAIAEAERMVFQRFDEAAMSPTWLGPAMGVSTGTAEDRVAILQAVSDAAAAAVVADLVDRDVADALSIDAEQVLGLADGEAFEGAMSRTIEPPAPDLDDPPGRRVVVYGGALVGGLLVGIAGAALVAVPIGVAGGLVFAMIVLAQGRRDPDDQSTGADGA